MKLILKGTRDSWTGIVAEVIDMGAYEIPAPLIVNSTMSPSALLQANHQMVPVTVDVSVANSCDSRALILLGVTENSCPAKQDGSRNCMK
jgi:hypothetical protein